MPAPATTSQPWWSYDIGLIHFIGISTEHNFTIGSPQIQWLENDLKSTNRTVTPWVVFSGHRSMYVDSNFCCQSTSSYELLSTSQCMAQGIMTCSQGEDVEVMQSLQANVEYLLYKYRVNLAFSGHFHNVQRQGAVYQNKLVQHSVEGHDSAGNLVHYHDNPNATVWMLIGSAGNGPDLTNQNYSWSEKSWDYMFGYAIVTAVNATQLDWKFINSANDDVIDRMTITQNFAPWESSITVNSGSDSRYNKGWNSLSEPAQAGIISAIVIVGVAFIALLIALVALRKSNSPSSKSANNGNKNSNNDNKGSGGDVSFSFAASSDKQSTTLSPLRESEMTSKV